MSAAPLSAPIPASAPAFAIPNGVAFVVAGGTIIGLAPILARISEAGPLATAGWRMLLAAGVLLPLLLAARSEGASVPRRNPFWALIAGTFFAIDIGFFHSSLMLTSVAHATLIVNLAPVIALGAGFLWFGERFGSLKVAGTIVSLGGAGVMTLGRADIGGTLEGNLLAFIGMFGYAAYLIAVKQARQAQGALLVMFLSSAIAAALLLGGAAIAGERIFPETANGWLVLLALGLVVHALGQGLVTLGMRTTAVGLASILLLMQPVCGGVFAWMIFGESLGMIELAGAAAVLLGIAMAMRAGK